MVAAKAIFSQSMTAELEEIGREIHMLAALHHPNIITFYGVAKDAVLGAGANPLTQGRSEEHTSELQSPLIISYAVFCLDRKSTRLNSSHP